MINSYSKEETELVKTATIYGINGPVIYLKGNTGFRMSEMVYVGDQKLVGEVISLDKDLTTVQVYEETTGLHPGEKVIASGSPVSVTLAPGILNNIFDGIERPLEQIAESSGGAFITRGVSVRKNGPHISQFVRGRNSMREILSQKSLRQGRSHINVWFLPMSADWYLLLYRTENIRSMRHWSLCSLQTVLKKN